MKNKKERAEKFLRQVMYKARLTPPHIWDGLIIPIEHAGGRITDRVRKFRMTRAKLAKAAGIHAMHDHNQGLLVEIADWANHDRLQEISRKFYELRGLKIPLGWNVLVVEGIDHRTYNENVAAMALVELATRFAKKGSLKREYFRKGNCTEELLHISD